MSIERRIGDKWSLMLGATADYTRDSGPDRHSQDEVATYRSGQVGLALGGRYVLSTPDAWAEVSVDAALTGIYRSSRVSGFEFAWVQATPNRYVRAVRTADHRVGGLQVGFAVERVLSRGLSLRARLDVANAYLFRSRETYSQEGVQEEREGAGYNLSAPLAPSLELRFHF